MFRRRGKYNCICPHVFLRMLWKKNTIVFIPSLFRFIFPHRYISQYFVIENHSFARCILRQKKYEWIPPSLSHRVLFYKKNTIVVVNNIEHIFLLGRKMQLCSPSVYFKICCQRKSNCIVPQYTFTLFFVAGTNPIVLFFCLFRCILPLGKCNCIAPICVFALFCNRKQKHNRILPPSMSHYCVKGN